MASEFIATLQQTVPANNNVIFTETVVPPCCDVRHRDESGIFNLRGGHQYSAFFSGNLTSDTANAPVSLALAVDGEPIPSTAMTVTPTAAGDEYNVARKSLIDVPSCCCYTLSVKNITATAARVSAANLVIAKER